MYFLIETEEQLQTFAQKDLNEVFLHVIPMNDRVHPAIQDISLLYLRPLKGNNGYLLSHKHNEALSIDKETLWTFLSTHLSRVYVLDGKTTLHYHLPVHKIHCINTVLYLNNKPLVREENYDGVSHKFFYGRYPDLPHINSIIPVSSHLQKWDRLFSGLRWDNDWFSHRLYQFYNGVANRVFCRLEREGIKLDIHVFRQKFSPKMDEYSVKGDVIYTQYNLFTSTGRPSNTFNNINFAALNKSDASRTAFVPKNDVLVEFDYRAYHIRILAQMVDYEFGEEDIHEHLGKLYYSSKTLTQEQYAESKSITFRLLFGENKNRMYADLEFFKRVYAFKEKLWQEYETNGYIASRVSGRHITGIEHRNQLLPYLLQMFETERNILVLSDIQRYLHGKQSGLVLYSYDAVVIDYAGEDGTALLQHIQELLEEGYYTTSVSYGKNYGEMKGLE